MSHHSRRFVHYDDGVVFMYDIERQFFRRTFFFAGRHLCEINANLASAGNAQGGAGQGFAVYPHRPLGNEPL